MVAEIVTKPGVTDWILPQVCTPAGTTNELIDRGAETTREAVGKVVAVDAATNATISAGGYYLNHRADKGEIDWADFRRTVGQETLDQTLSDFKNPLTFSPLHKFDEVSDVLRFADEAKDARKLPGGSWVLPKAGGGTYIGDRYYTEHALERMAPDTPEVRAELTKRALARAEAKGLKPGTPEFKQFWNDKGPDPRGVPPSVVESEIANPGSTGVRVVTVDHGRLISVIPAR